MTIPDPVPAYRPQPRSRRGWVASAVVALALVVTGGLLVGQAYRGSGPPPASRTAAVRSVAAAPWGIRLPRLPWTSLLPGVPSLSSAPARTTVATSRGPSAAQVRRAAGGLVDIDTVLDRGRARGAGTGIVLAANGIVLTNNHVVAGASRIAVTDLATGRTFQGQVLGTDPAHDVAVVRALGASGLPTAPLASGSGLAVGAPVVGIGNAGGIGTPSASAGVVVGLGRTVTAADDGSNAGSETLTGMIETTAGLRPGDSGGALIDGSGRVVGLDTAAASDASRSFAIPIGRALAVANRIA